MSPGRLPRRIVCLTEETTEVLYRLGEQDRIVGVSGYTVRPPEARRDKPRVSSFLTARTERILQLRPDLVLAFSDLQADIARDLAAAGLQVMVFNQRTVAGILDMIALLGGIVGAGARADALVRELEEHLASIRVAVPGAARRPRVYFEEWDDPLISGIGWVSELIEIAGGQDCFAEHATSAAATGRIIAEPAEVVRRAPDIIVGSWCGKKFRPERVAARPGWEEIPAVRDGHLYDVPSSEILQPGPAALTDGVRRLHEIVMGWHGEHQGDL